MISKKYFRLKKNGEPYWNCYCKNPELIENYDKAIADRTQMWEVHHRKEEFYSYKELIERNEYYDVSPEELIFLTKTEHRKIDSHCKRVSEAMKGKKVLCVETGEIFDSIHEAERKTGIYSQNISAVCNGKFKSAGGFHWKFL